MISVASPGGCERRHATDAPTECLSSSSAPALAGAFYVQPRRINMKNRRVASTPSPKAPPELTMLGKTLLNLDHVARAIAPDLDVNATIREQAVTLMRQRMIKSASPATLLS